MDATKTIIISTPLPKYVSKLTSVNASFGIPLSRGSNVLASSNSNVRTTSCLMSKASSVTCISTTEEETSTIMPSFHTSNRKRRLDHLSQEEKIQRKKLKNRMAAQSSRDRKKAKMDELEAEVKRLKEKNNILVQQCQNLKCEKQQLLKENEELQRKLNQSQTLSVSSSPVVVGPAVSYTIDPLQQGQRLQLALGLHLMIVFIFWTCLRTWKGMTTYPILKNLQTLYFRKLNLENRASHLCVVNLREVICQWWGHHQKAWTPIEIKLKD